jgi:hypothetical protein
LKAWQQLALGLLRVAKTTPPVIRQSTETQFAVVDASLEVVGHGSTNIHDSAYRTFKALSAQSEALKEATMRFLEKTDQGDVLKRIDSDLKGFSRSLNEGFSREFGQCGISQPEIVRLRTRAYTACCDVIGQLKTACVFDGDVARLIGRIGDFQDALREWLVRNNVTTSFLVAVERVQPGEEEDKVEEESVEYEFDGDLELLDFVDRCERDRQMIRRNAFSFDRLFHLLKVKARRATDGSLAGVSDLGRIVDQQERRIGALRHIVLDFLQISEDAVDAESDEQLATSLDELRRKQQEGTEESERQISLLTEGMRVREVRAAELESEIRQLKEEMCVMKSHMDGHTMDLRQLTGMHEKVAHLLHCPRDGICEAVSQVLRDSNESSAELRKIQSVCNEVRGILANGSDCTDLVTLARNCVGSRKEDEQFRLVLDKICVSTPGQRRIDQCQSCVRAYETLRSQNSDLLAGYQTLSGILDIPFTGNPETIIAGTRVIAERSAASLTKIAKALSGLSGLSPCSAEDSILGQIDEIRRQTDIDRETLTVFQRIYSELENRLCAFLEMPKNSKKSPCEFVQIMLKALEARQSDVRILKTLTIRLAAMTHVDMKTGPNPTKLLDALDDLMRKQRLAIEAIAPKAGLNPSMESLALLRRIEEHIEKGPSPSPGAPTGLDEMFAPIFELMPVTSRTDYRVYLPEICSGFLSLHNSVMCLKPFATTLNAIFTQFDCKFASFCPGSKPYQFMKTQVYALHGALNSLVPSKINSLVFLVISRFIALFSSFMSALTASAYNSSDQKMKTEFFQLQQSLTKIPPFI